MLLRVQTARAMYSSPPKHGAAIVTTILSDPELYAAWKVGVPACAAVVRCGREAGGQCSAVQSPGSWPSPDLPACCPIWAFTSAPAGGAQGDG